MLSVQRLMFLFVGFATVLRFGMVNIVLRQGSDLPNFLAIGTLP